MIENFNINSNEIDKMKNITQEEKVFRERNLESFKSSGFPNKKFEDWKFSDFREIVNKNFDELEIQKNISNNSNNINLIKDFEHNYIFLVNGNLYSSNFDYEEKNKIKINKYSEVAKYQETAGITITQNEVEQKLLEKYLPMGEMGQQYIQYIRGNKEKLQEFMSIVMEDKVIKDILAKVTLVDKKFTTEELENLSAR